MDIELETVATADPAISRVSRMPNHESRAVPTDFDRDVACIFGLAVDVLSTDRALMLLRIAARQGRRCFLSTPNLNFLIGSLHDPAFRDSVICSDLSLADGMPLVWLGRLLGLGALERVPGSTVFERLRIEAQHGCMKVYLFGGVEDAGARAAAALNAGATGVRCVGHANPGHGSVEDMSSAETIGAINRCAPDFVVVALGARKGQAWIQRNRDKLAAPIVSHLGAVINMVAGTITRAPMWVQRIGFEWLWRVKEEPALWRRYAGDGLVLLKLLMTRALPCYVYSRATPDRASVGRSCFRTHCVGDTAFIRLTGPACAPNLAGVRAAMREATATARDVIVRFHDVHYVDSAFLGLCLLLHGHQCRAGRRLTFEGLSARMRKIFRAHCVGFLLDPEPVFWRSPVEGVQAGVREHA